MFMQVHELTSPSNVVPESRFEHWKFKSTYRSSYHHPNLQALTVIIVHVMHVHVEMHFSLKDICVLAPSRQFSLGMLFIKSYFLITWTRHPQKKKKKKREKKLCSKGSLVCIPKKEPTGNSIFPTASKYGKISLQSTLQSQNASVNACSWI